MSRYGLRLITLCLLLALPSTARAWRVFWINQWSGECFLLTDSASADPAGPYLATFHDGDPPTGPTLSATYLFTVPLWLPYVANLSVKQQTPGEIDPSPRPRPIPPPRYPLTWCEMTDSAGQTLYSVGNWSVDQLKLNLFCECLVLNTCTEEVNCRPEGPVVFTPIVDQISVPLCK